VPLFEFQCEDCGIRFEKLSKSSEEAGNAAPCPECGDDAKRQVSVVNHTFAHTPNGPVPQNTGVSQIDHNFDRVIGRDAEQKWALIEERKQHKEAVLKEARKNGVDAQMEHLVRTREGAGDYRVIDKKEREVVNARRTLADAVNKAASEPAPAGE